MVMNMAEHLCYLPDTFEAETIYRNIGNIPPVGRVSLKLANVIIETFRFEYAEKTLAPSCC